MRMSVEIVKAAHHRKVTRPIVGVAFQGQALPGLYLDDAVGARADGNGERLVLEMIGVGVGGREHRHQRQRQGQFAVVGAGKIEAHGIGIRRFTDLTSA